MKRKNIGGKSMGKLLGSMPLMKCLLYLSLPQDLTKQDYESQTQRRHGGIVLMFCCICGRKWSEICSRAWPRLLYNQSMSVTACPKEALPSCLCSTVRWGPWGDLKEITFAHPPPTFITHILSVIARSTINRGGCRPGREMRCWHEMLLLWATGDPCNAAPGKVQNSNGRDGRKLRN